MGITDIFQVNQDISNLEVLLKFDTNDGLALNVHKYQSVPTKAAAADVEKCNLTMKRLSEMEGKVGAALSRLQERKNSLYCPNNVPKKWANSELIFIDQHLKTLDELKRRVCSFNCNVVHTYKMLSGRFSRDTVTAAERSRKRRRNKEQRRKSIKRQKEKGKKQAFKLIRNIYGKEMADQVFSGKVLADTEKLNSRGLGDIKLLPHSHLNALEYLLQIDAMDNKQTVQYYIALLKTRKQMKAVPPKAEDQPPEDQLSESSGDETD